MHTSGGFWSVCFAEWMNEKVREWLFAESIPGVIKKKNEYLIIWQHPKPAKPGRKKLRMC